MSRYAKFGTVVHLVRLVPENSMLTGATFCGWPLYSDEISTGLPSGDTCRHCLLYAGGT